VLQEPLAQADAAQQVPKAQAAHRWLSAPVALGGRRMAAASAQAATSLAQCWTSALAEAAGRMAVGSEPSPS
jgi:hypothetical protein